MIGIIDYGMGNLRSVQKALEYVGAKTVITSDEKALDGCDRLILPGVGSFGAGMENLRKTGLDGYVKAQRKPLLGICLGMQFLLSQSEEEGDFAGLDLIPGRVIRFDCGKIPHMGWNSVNAVKSPLFEGMNDGAQFYFVHSYYVETAEEYTLAKTEYHREYASVVGKENFYGVQFHPEKSGEVGLALLRNFMRI